MRGSGRPIQDFANNKSIRVHMNHGLCGDRRHGRGIKPCTNNGCNKEFAPAEPGSVRIAVDDIYFDHLSSDGAFLNSLASALSKLKVIIILKSDLFKVVIRVLC